MNRLGIIRIVTAGGSFEIPYSEESSFISTVVAVPANSGFKNEMLFVPYHSIGFMVKVPDHTPATSEFEGMTKQ
jgi:hypothetical protein